MKLILLLALFAPPLSTLAPAQPRASELTAITLTPTEGGFTAIFQGDGTLEHRVVKEQNPAQRLVIDVLGVRNPLRHYYPAENHPFLERILMYEYPEATNPAQSGPLARIVFELKHDIDYETTSHGDEIHVTFWESGTLAPIDGSRESTGPAPASMPVAPVADVPFDLDADSADLPTPAIADSETHDTESELATPDPPDPTAPLDPNVPENVSIQPEDIPLSLFFDPAATPGGDYRLGPEDVIEVRVFELDQLNRKVRISGDGFIDLPLVGTVRAAGLSAEEVALAVADQLRDRYVQNPQVSIFIVEFNSQKVSLLGAVQSPSTYPLAGQRQLLQVLADAGSLAADAGKTLYIFRQTEQGRSARLTVPLNELLLQGDPRWNIALLPGDVVSVPPEEAIAVSILGAVNSPGVHKLPVGDEATLLKAIALAGGLSERASKKGVQIKRRELAGDEKIIKVNLSDLLSGKIADVILVEGDVVVVNESFF